MNQIQMIPIVSYDGSVRYEAVSGPGGLAGLGDPISQAVNVITSFIGSIVTKNDFFDARNKVTWEMANIFAQYYGLDAKKMDDYYWRRITNPGTTEKKVIDEWWKALNDECIGEAAVSPCSDSFLHENFISTKNISGHWKDALGRLQKASEIFLSKYFSQAGTQAQQQLVNDIYLERTVKQQAQQQQSQYAQASVPGTSFLAPLKAKYNSLTPEGKTVVVGTVATGSLFLLIALLKATNAIK